MSSSSLQTRASAEAQQYQCLGNHYISVVFLTDGALFNHYNEGTTQPFVSLA